jgi:hypothetical protein
MDNLEPPAPAPDPASTAISATIDAPRCTPDPTLRTVASDPAAVTQPGAVTPATSQPALITVPADLHDSIKREGIALYQRNAELEATLQILSSQLDAAKTAGGSLSALYSADFAAIQGIVDGCPKELLTNLFAAGNHIRQFVVQRQQERR